jgi:DNA-binding MarR family transcriptional regulator
MDLDTRGMARLRTFIELLEHFRALDRELPIQYAVSFLHIAMKDGAISITDLEKLVHLSQSATSRNVQALSKTFKAGVPGHNLVEARENIDDRREKLLRLTPRGKQLLGALLRTLAKA